MQVSVDRALKNYGNIVRLPFDLTIAGKTEGMQHNYDYICGLFSGGGGLFSNVSVKPEHTLVE